MTPEPRSTELWKITLGELDEKMGVKIVEESVERVVATIHPSSILRARDSEGRHAALALLVADLKVVAKALRS